MQETKTATRNDHAHSSRVIDQVRRGRDGFHGKRAMGKPLRLRNSENYPEKLPSLSIWTSEDYASFGS